MVVVAPARSGSVAEVVAALLLAVGGWRLSSIGPAVAGAAGERAP